MNGAIMLQVAKGWDDQTLLQLVQAPNVIDDIGITVFKCAELPPLGAPDALRAHGQALLKSLMDSHEGVKAALKQALMLANGSCCPIYLQLKSLPLAESICWEALCDPAVDFIALDPRWPVARVAGMPSPIKRETRAFQAPLRIMAVLSALNRDARGQWNELYAAVKKARDAGLPITLKVATGQEVLQDEIRELAKIDPDLHIFPLQSMIDLITEADDFQPHITSFFCHGSASFGKPRLQLATMADVDAGSIEVTLPDLLNSPGVRDSWLLVLNCCESGAASKSLHSLSHSLVAGGINAVIGMKSEISEVDAAEFSKRLFPSLLTHLRDCLKALQPGHEEAVEWARAMSQPRRALSERHQQDPGAFSWTLPVLYVQPEPFRIKREAPEPAEKLAHERTVDELLALLPPEKRELFLKELVAVREGR